MKLVHSISVLLLTSNVLWSQAPITLNYADFPVAAGVYNYNQLSGANVPSPALGANQNWNYAALTSTDSQTSTYWEEVDPFYTAEGIDIYVYFFKQLSPALALGFRTFSELDLNEEGFAEEGIYVEEQSYPLGALTGNNSDNLSFPLQEFILNAPRQIMQFPMTAGSAWESSSRRAYNFTLKVTAFGLNNTPGQLISTFVRKDSVAGWGKLRVYTPNGPSVPYDVLMSRTVQFSVDSFFLGGAPAPPALLNAFSVSQGQQADVSHQYNFYRAGNLNYLLRINYGSDNTFTTPENVFVNTDNLSADPSSAGDLNVATYSTVLFPNPSNGQRINLFIQGKTVAEASYTLTDLSGKTVQSGQAQPLSGNTLSFSVASELPAGTYILNVHDTANQLIAAEPISIQR
jgi:hypothetical protein